MEKLGAGREHSVVVQGMSGAWSGFQRVVLETLLNYCTSGIKAVKVETRVPSGSPRGHAETK